jgi:hypothetical protein
MAMDTGSQLCLRGHPRDRNRVGGCKNLHSGDGVERIIPKVNPDANPEFLRDGATGYLQIE